MKPVGKPDAGNPHVRFDERGGETDRSRDTAPLLELYCPLDCFAAAAAGPPISGAITAHAPNRLSRLRGSMYSFIDTASRNSPMNVITTSTTGNAIHHQMPATSAVCWLAQ